MSPSQQTISTSLMPRLASSAHAPAQNFAPSDVWTQMPRTCLTPSRSTPTATWAARCAPGPVFDFHHDSVQILDRIQRLQRPSLPGLDLSGDLVGDLGDRLVGQLGADRGGQVGLNVAHRHAAGIQADDHLIEAAEAARPLRYQLRVKLPLRSRGTASSTSPTSLETVLAVVPLREFGNNEASASPRS